jgi:hypothetical protein
MRAKFQRMSVVWQKPRVFVMLVSDEIFEESGRPGSHDCSLHFEAVACLLFCACVSLRSSNGLS